MTENKRYKVAIYDEKAIGGYCVLDLEKPSQTARLKYKNVYISSKAGCNIVCDLLNEKEERIHELGKENMEYYKLINCRKCKYHNYDSYGNGDDFEICEKGNNERLIYYYFCNEFEK